jgi:PhoH-like ATPase
MKTFVLDTNVLIHDPEALFTFEGSRVVLPLAVVEELDNFKRLDDNRGRSARAVNRYLDELRRHGKLSDGVPLEHGGELRIEVQTRVPLPEGFHYDSKDNQMLEVALGLFKKGETVVFITKDINLRIKAEAIGLIAEDYEKSKVHPDQLYLGWHEKRVSSEVIDKFFKEKRLQLGDVAPGNGGNGHVWQANEMVILHDEAGGSQSALCRFDAASKEFLPLIYGNANPWGLKPLNTEQRFALELLMRKDVKMVSLVGVPGSGKTLLALAAGLEQIFEEKIYRRMLVARPVIPVGRDIGFLPGSKEEKLTSWMGAIYDNLELLSDRPETTEASEVDELFESGKIVVEAVAFLRGRSLPNQYIVIDDAQNLTPHEIKTVISRVGEGSKIVLTGDPFQIDNPYLDASSTGLANLVERFKGQSIYGHMTFSKIERSTLAALASQLL